jgi:hypothetical protein
MIDRYIAVEKTDFLNAYKKVRKENSLYKFAFLPPKLVQNSNEFPPAYNGFVALSLEQFLRFIVPDLVSDPDRFLSSFEEKFGKVADHLPLMAHHIVQVKKSALNNISPATTNTNGANPVRNSDSYNDVIQKLYRAYCDMEENASLRLAPSDFFEFYTSINLYTLDNRELNGGPPIGYRSKDLDAVLDIFNNKLELTKQDQIETLYRFFVKNEQAVELLADQKTYAFTHTKDISERRNLLYKALTLLAKIPPLDVLCALSIAKKSCSLQGKARTESAIGRNDITLENGLIFKLFTSSLTIDAQLDESIAIFFPSAFFIRKWTADKSLQGKKVVFILPNDAMCGILSYHYSNPDYAYALGNNVTFLSYDAWKSASNLSTNFKKVLLFAHGMSLAEQSDWYASIKKFASVSIDIFALIGSYEFENALSPFSQELADPQIHIDSIALIPQGINNSTTPRRKIFLAASYSLTVQTALAPTRVYSYTLNTDLKVQALYPLPDVVEVDSRDLVGLYKSIRQLYKEEILKRRAAGRQKIAAFSHPFTPDLDIWCNKSFPKNNSDRPRIEAYMCLPPDPDKRDKGFLERGPMIKETRKRATKIPEDELFSWLENCYPFSKVQPRRSTQQSQSVSGSDLIPSLDIRNTIINVYTPIMAGQNIALKTFWYLYPNLEDLYSARGYRLLSEMVLTEIGQLRIDDFTPEVTEQLLLTCYPDESQDLLWMRFRILSLAITQAVNQGYSKKNLLLRAVNDRSVQDKLFAQVRRALVKKHFTQEEMLQAFTAIDKRIQEGKSEYIGVLIRLLTGLESNIVCALKWKDLQQITDYNLFKIMVTRQVTNDGTTFKGFDSLQDYRCVPCVLSLKKRLEEHLNKVKQMVPGRVRLEDIPIVNTQAAISHGKQCYLPYSPRELEARSREILAEIGISDRIVEVPDRSSGTKETNLNHYGGDLFRENFRHWAIQAAKLTNDEVQYLLGNKPETTLGTYYCDFLNDASQLTIFTKLQRWDALFSGEHIAQASNVSIPATRELDQTFFASSRYPLQIQVQLLAQKGQGSMSVSMSCNGGLSTYITPLSMS